MAKGTQLIDEMETQVRMARTFRLPGDYGLGYNSDPASPRTVNHLLDDTRNERLISLFRSPWVTEDRSWPSSTPDKVDYLLALLGQQIETWHPRCAATGKPNGIEARYKVPDLTEHLKKLASRWEAYLDSHQVL